MTTQPNAAETRWRESVREMGSVLSGAPAVIHHAAGRTARHNKVDIGHWWLIPLTDDEHKRLHGGEYGKDRKEMEKHWFVHVLKHLADHPDKPSGEVQDAIFGYHR